MDISDLSHEEFQAFLARNRPYLITQLLTEQEMRARRGREWLGPDRCAARAAEMTFGDEATPMFMVGAGRPHRLVPADLLADGDLRRAAWPTRKTEYT